MEIEGSILLGIFKSFYQLKGEFKWLVYVKVFVLRSIVHLSTLCIKKMK